MARTTIALDDGLMQRLREMAARQGKTLNQTVAEIVLAYFRPKKRVAAFTLEWNVVKGRQPPAVDPADRDRLYDILDRPS